MPIQSNPYHSKTPSNAFQNFQTADCKSTANDPTSPTIQKFNVPWTRVSAYQSPNSFQSPSWNSQTPSTSITTQSLVTPAPALPWVQTPLFSPQH